MSNYIKYPRFISNHPCGEDIFLGKSQERIAKAISEHIKLEEQKTKNVQEGKKEICVPHIIGIEGSWGSGKSNLIRIIKENNLKDSHYIFEYDTWGHQEDLQRRSFLETLTNNLVNEEILTGTSKVELKNGEFKNVTWRKKLDYLLARKFETETEQFPKIGYGIIIAFFTAIFLPIFHYIASVSDNKTYWGTIIVSTPILVSLIIWGIKAYKNKKYRTLDFLLAVYQDKVTRNIEFKTISENEPSVTEFKGWMESVSKALIAENKQNLIIVYDNMDRLPANKVKELWSSIHTFFAEESYDNIWVIIPFDRNHLANAFGNSENEKNEVEAKKLTTHFINKTFPVIFRIAAPVISDLKFVFLKYFDDAFGKDGIKRKEKEKILRTFSIIKPNPTVRDIIAFINEIVLQEMTWEKEIPLLHIAIFTLTKDKILVDDNSIAENILAINYADGIQKLVENADELRESISALAYNIDLNNAKQIPMTHFLRNLFNDAESKSDINSYSEHKHFIEILHDVIQEIDLTQIIRAIKIVDNLDVKNVKDSNKRISEIWDYLTKQNIKQELISFKFEDEYKILLVKGDTENQKSILKYLCSSLQNNKEINGSDFYDTMSEIKAFLVEKKIDIDIDTYLKEKTVEPDVFIDYVETAKYDYKNFKLSCNQLKLNNYLIELLPEKMNKTVFFEYLIESSYDFSSFLKELESHIPTITKDNFYSLNYAYKVLYKEKPLKILLNQSQITTLLSTITDKSINGYFDLVAMALGLNIGVTVDGKDKEVLLELSKRMEYYNNYGELLKSSINWNNPVLNNVLKQLSINPQGTSKANITEVLPLCGQLLTNLKIEPDALLEKLNGWHESAEKSITKENIEQVIMSTLYSDSILTKNKLTAHIHKVAMEKLAEIEVNTLFQQRTQVSYYWLIVAHKLIEGKILISLTDNLVELVKKVLIDISASGTMPNDIIKTIIGNVAQSKITATIKEIGVEYYSGRRVMNAQIFTYFESYFRAPNRVKGHEGDYTNTVLKSIITIPDCRRLILDNKSFYIELIGIAGDDSENFKTIIKDLQLSQPNEELNDFAQQIGVVDKVESHEE